MDISCTTLPCTKGRFLGSLSDPGIDLTIVAIESRTVISKIDVIFVMLVVAVVVEVLLLVAVVVVFVVVVIVVVVVVAAVVVVVVS